MPRQRMLVIRQGSTWSEDFEAIDEAGAAVDLTGGDLAMQIRAGPESTIYATPSLEVTDPAAGTFTASLTAAETRDLYFRGAAYDIEFTAPDGEVTRLFEGPVTLSPEITR